MTLQGRLQILQNNAVKVNVPGAATTFCKDAYTEEHTQVKVLYACDVAADTEWENLFLNQP